MAPSATLKHFCLLLALFLACSHCCRAQDAAAIVAKAMLCFNNPTIYRNCAEQYRLTASGNLNVTKNETDAFCSGPCLAETQLVLLCIDGILSNFQFYNGATIRAVNTTLIIACGLGSGRGDFNVTENIGAHASVLSQGSKLKRSHVTILQDVGTFDLWIITLLMVIIIL